MNDNNAITISSDKPVETVLSGNPMVVNAAPYHTLSTCYLSPIFNEGGLEETIKSVIFAIRKSKIQFDTIVFRGMSGCLIAPSVCVELKKVPTMVRKQEESSHSSYKIEGLRGKFRYIIVDDGIASGETFREILDSIRHESPQAEFEGFFAYNQSNLYLAVRLSEFDIRKVKWFWYRTYNKKWKCRPLTMLDTDV